MRMKFEVDGRKRQGTAYLDLVKVCELPFSNTHTHTPTLFRTIQGSMNVGSCLWN